MKRMPRFLLAGLALGLLCAGSSHAAYPERTITMLVAAGAGGSADVQARAFSSLLSKELKETIIIKNLPGAGGTIGTAELNKAKPDGYTLAFQSMGAMVAQPNLRKLPYPWDAFTPIAMVTSNPQTVMCTKAMPWKSFRDAYEDIKANPGKYVYISSSPGGISHISQEAIFKTLGCDITHLPTRDTSAAGQSLISGAGQIYCDPPTMIRQFDLVGLAVLSPERSSLLPDVPTMKELGFTEVPDITLWSGLFAPANLPEDIRAELEEATRKVVASEEFRKLCDGMFASPWFKDSKETSRIFHGDYAMFNELLTELGFKQ